MSTEEFAAILQATAEEFAATQEQGITWYPEDSDYNCLVTGITRFGGKVKKTGKACANWRINLQIIDGTYAGKEFPLLLIGGHEITIGNMKALVHMVSGQECPADPTAADSLLDAFVDQQVKARVRYSEKSGFTNVSILEIIREDTVEAPETS